MARRVFFSFEYEHDVWRANVVRNSWVAQGREAAGFIDAVDFEEVKKGGDRAIKNWIDNQLQGASVTVVLVGSHTCASRWVGYEIEASKQRGNGLLGIDISSIRDQFQNTSWCADGFRMDTPSIVGTAKPCSVRWETGSKWLLKPLADNVSYDDLQLLNCKVQPISSSH